MRKTRGFKLGGRKIVKVFKWFVNGRSKQTSRQRLEGSSCSTRAISKICNWVRNLKLGAKGLCFYKSNSGYIRVGEDPIETEKAVTVGVPKGHLAVYVGERGDDTQRFLVPVIYFNHPLFGDLLRESEKVYGFNHTGGIQIPCPKSEFENVQMRIAAGGGHGGDGCRRRRRWGRHYWML